MSHHNDTSVGNGTIVDKSNVKSCADNNKKPVKCKLNVDECISLLDILKSFNAPISEEHVWALCYQCTKCFRNCFVQYPDRCRLVKKLDQVAVHKDGYVHPSTLVCDDNNENWDRNREKLPSERKLLAGLGYIIFQAFDFGIDEDEERAISPQLEKVLNCMIQKEERSTCDDKFLQQQQQRNHQFQLSEHQQVETDDEGIEKDSADCDDELSRSKRPYNVTFDRVLQLCASHVGSSEIEEADQHYRAVCRALVTEALELSSFLQQVSEGGTNDLRQKANTVATSEALDSLNFSDWARLWVQVIRELRQGVNLKKVEYNRAPIEYELTPYEILMEDIRSRRYKLNKVMVDGNIPAPVKKDAHAIILEFIRSRPPLKKASDRKLPPPRTRQISPRERLLESIKQGNVKLRRPTLNQQKRIIVPNEMSAATTSTLTSNGISQRQGSTRRLIKVDYSVIQNLYGEDDENDLDKDESDSSAVDKTPNDKEPTKWPNQNGASNQSNGNSYNSSNVLFRTGTDNSRESIKQLWRRSYLRNPSSNPEFAATFQRSASVDLADIAAASTANRSKRASLNCSLL